MANTIKIKRSTTTATPATLAEGELAFSELSGNLFIGKSGGNIEVIGGAGLANQDTFANITDGTNTASADSASDTFTVSAGTGISAVVNGTTDTLTITNTAPNQTTNLGIANKTATTLDITSSDGTNATVPAATTSLAGLMTSTDKTKLDGLSNYTHPIYNYTAPVDDNETTLTTIDLISELTVSNGHVTGGTKRNLVAGTNVTITASTDGDITIASTDTNTDTNTTYSHKISSITGGAGIDLDAGGSGSGTDTINIKHGTGITVARVDADNMTITNTAPNVTTNITTTHNSTNVVVNSSDGTDGTINGATTSLAGVMTATDKTRVDTLYTWYSNMTTADGDSIIDTINEMLAAFTNAPESLNVYNELTAPTNMSLDGGTF